MIIGIGTDLLDYRRLEESANKQGPRFLEKIFTLTERQFCNARKANPFATYGTTFAGKEAVLKAMGNVQDIGWHDIEIVRLENGKPTVKLYKIAHERCLSLSGGAYVFHLSLTDEPPYAQAFAILQKA